jgi:hypothetical protein
MKVFDTTDFSVVLATIMTQKSFLVCSPDIKNHQISAKTLASLAKEHIKFV